MTRTLTLMLALVLAIPAGAWDFRDEVYVCTTQGMTLAELQSAGVTLVSHCPCTHEWMAEAAEHGIRGMPYISLYKVYDTSAPGAGKDHPFWSAVDITDHPEWLYIGPDGQRKRPFNNEFYPPMFWQSCTNNATIADAYCAGAAGVINLGAGGVFIDNVLPAAKCYGPETGVHEHLYKDNIESFKIALGRVQDTVHSLGPDKVVMLNIGNPFERWAPYGDCIMLESFIYNVAVKPGPGGWVGKERVQSKQWPQILEWIKRTAEHVDGGGSIVALEYLPDDTKAAFFSYVADKLANFLWTGESRVRRDVCRTLYRCRLQRASGPLTETDGVYWRHYPNGMVALNPTDERASIRIEMPEGVETLADVATDEALINRRGKVRLTLKPGEGHVYVTPLALAEGHLREALVAAETALATAAPDEITPQPAPLLAAVEAIRAAHATIADATDPSAAREPIADALRAVDACLGQDAEPGLTARLASGEDLTREQLIAAVTPPDCPAPEATLTDAATTISAAGVKWTIADDVGLITARGMGAKLGLSVPALHPTHGWLNPSQIIDSELVTDEPGRKVVRATLSFEGAKTREVIEGIVLDLQVEANAGDPTLAVTAAVRNTAAEPLPAYFIVSSSGTGKWFASPGEPAQAGGEYLQVPHTDWTFVTSGPHGGPGLAVVTDQPQSYSRYCLHLYSEPRSGDIAPGQSRAISFRMAQVAGPWQANPQVSGPLTRAQIYLSRAWSLAAEGRGLPQPSPISDQIAGMPQLVRLCGACAMLHGVDLSLDGMSLLDANGAATIPAEIEASPGMATFTTRPSLRDDLFYQVVGKVTCHPENLPMAIAIDFKPGPSVALDSVGDANWAGAAGVATWSASNHLDREVTCHLEVAAPEGYTAAAPDKLTLAPGQSAEVTVKVTSPVAAAAPSGVTVTLTLDDFPGAGSLTRTAEFHSTIACPLIPAPVLDGRLDDPAWQQAASLPAFGLVADGSAPTESTLARIGHDADYLYLAFECMDSNMAALVANLQPAPNQNDNAVHADDTVEVFLDPPGELPYMQLVTNALGARKTRGDAAWEVATTRDADRWTVEMRIKLDSLGLPITPGAKWGANFCRVHKRTGEASCWAPTGGSFHVPARFGTLVFE